MAEVKKTTKTTSTKTATKKSAAPKKAVAPKTEPVKAVEKTEVKSAKKAVKKQIKVTLVKSTIGYNKNQARIVKALGLGKLNSSHVLPDNECVRGMIFKVSHLVKVEELN